MEKDIVVCPQCKEDYKPKLIKMGKYWAEILDDYDKLCDWCSFSLNERDNNEYM